MTIDPVANWLLKNKGQLRLVEALSDPYTLSPSLRLVIDCVGQDWSKITLPPANLQVAVDYLKDKSKNISELVKYKPVRRKAK